MKEMRDILSQPGVMIAMIVAAFVLLLLLASIVGASASECRPSLKIARAAHPSAHIRWNHGCYYVGAYRRQVARGVPAPRPISSTVAQSAMATARRSFSPHTTPVESLSPGNYTDSNSFADRFTPCEEIRVSDYLTLALALRIVGTREAAR